MPQMNKGGKFIFGKSLIRTDGTLRIPPQAMEEYHIADEGKVYLFIFHSFFSSTSDFNVSIIP